MTLAAAPTLELQGLAGCELPQLAVGQGELVPLELQCHGRLCLGDSARRPREGSQLGDSDHLPTCGTQRRGSCDAWGVSAEGT